MVRIYASKTIVGSRLEDFFILYTFYFALYRNIIIEYVLATCAVAVAVAVVWYSIDGITHGR